MSNALYGHIWNSRRGLAVRMLLLTVVLILISQIALAAIGYMGQMRQQERLRGQAGEAAKDMLVQEMNAMCQDVEVDARWLATNAAFIVALAQDDKLALMAELTSWPIRSNPDYVAIYDEFGERILSHWSAPSIEMPQAALNRATNQPTWSTVEVDNHGLWALAQVPVRVGDRVVGAVALGKVLKPLQLRAAAGLLSTSDLVICEGNQIIDSTIDDVELTDTVNAFALPASRIDVLNEHLQGLSHYAAGHSIGSSGYILVIIRTAVSDAIIADQNRLVMVASLLILCFVIPTCLWFYRKISHNLASVVSVGEEMMHGRYDQRIAPSGVSDIDNLATTINHLAQQVEQQIKAISHQAFYDALTGLPNRLLFADRIRQTLARASRQNRSVAVLFMDIDNFKLVNDSLGHPAGDALLAAVARRISTVLRDGDTAARISGDEFTVLLEEIQGINDAIAVAERIQTALQEPFRLDKQEVFVTMSIGIAISSIDRDDPEALVRDADIALYRAKTNGKARFELFDPAMNAQISQRLELETDLRRAIERQELVVVYQPVIGLGTREIVEVEALLRWNHPRLGLVMPSEFIPLAEETGLIVSLGRWVLTEACKQTACYHCEHPEQTPLRISVNLSPRQLLDHQLVNMVADTLAETGLAPGCLQLEITESVMLRDTEAVIATLNQLKHLGVKLAIDDFGTGYSSLSYLKRFPVDTLKIDREFVAHLGEDPRDLAIVEAVVAFARTMNLVVTGEGIETERQLELLKRLGCGQGQGYYFARPTAGVHLSSVLAQCRAVMH